MSKSWNHSLKEDLNFVDPRSSFSRVHVVKALLLLNKSSMGRTKLIRNLGLGEASVRTLLKKLNEEDVAEPSTKGHKLTERGKEMAESLAEKISQPTELQASNLTVGECNSAVLVKDASEKVGNGMEQRDAAIKAGGEGATTIVYEGGGLLLKEENIDSPEKIKSKFDLEEGNVIIIGSAENYRKAEEAALAAVLTVI